MNSLPPPDEKPLFEVVTIAEAARLWGKHRTSILRAIESKHNPLCARKCAGNRSPWLITIESLKRRFGDPVEHPHNL